MSGIILNNLSEDHPLRNTPLGELDVEHRWKKAPDKGIWTCATTSPNILHATFNELGDCWKHDYWRLK